MPTAIAMSLATIEVIQQLSKVLVNYHKLGGMQQSTQVMMTKADSSIMISVDFCMFVHVCPVQSRQCHMDVPCMYQVND